MVRLSTTQRGIALVIAAGVFGLAFAGCISSEDPVAAVNGSDPCPDYCDKVLASCSGENSAFSNRDHCLKTCKLLPRGSEDVKNTVECRLSAAGAVGTKATCANASAYGGGACGDRCVTFCGLVERNCIAPLGAAAPYRTSSDCQEACGRMTFDPAGVEGTAQAADGPDTLNCRMYHLLLSITDRDTHCPHVGVVSATCRAR